MHFPATRMALQPEPPLPKDLPDARRWDWTSRAHDILYAQWDDQLRARMHEKIGQVRTNRIGGPDLTANLLLEISEQSATLFDAAPTVSHETDAEAAVRMAGWLEGALLWSLMQVVQRDTVALREMLIRVDASSGAPVYRPVWPHRVLAGAAPSDPMRPVWIREARLRERGERWVWTWDELDISDPDNPSYRILTVATGSAPEEQEADVTGEYLDTGALTGDAYPYRYADRTPFLPYVLYHAKQTGKLWNAWGNREVVEGTLNNGVHYTGFGHNLLQNSWFQRWANNARLAGENVGESDRESEVDADPSMVLMFVSVDPDAGQPTFGQWNPPVDPIKYLEGVKGYEQRILSKFVKSASAKRKDGTATSGYALSLSLEEKRAEQRRLEPLFRAGDLELLRKTAATLRLAGSDTLPEDGWKITYAGIPLSAEERESIRKDAIEKLSVKLITPIEAYRALNPGATELMAETALEKTGRLGGPDIEVDTDVDADVDADIEAPEGEDIAKTALNGAQVTSMVEVVKAVAERLLPAASAALILQRAFQLSQSEANAIINPAESFEIQHDDEPAPPPPDDEDADEQAV